MFVVYFKFVLPHVGTEETNGVSEKTKVIVVADIVDMISVHSRIPDTRWTSRITTLVIPYHTHETAQSGQIWHDEAFVQQ